MEFNGLKPPTFSCLHIYAPTKTNEKRGILSNKHVDTKPSRRPNLTQMKPIVWCQLLKYNASGKVHTYTDVIIISHDKARSWFSVFSIPNIVIFSKWMSRTACTLLVSENQLCVTTDAYKT